MRKIKHFIQLWWQSFTDKTPKMFHKVFIWMASLAALAEVLHQFKEKLPETIQDVPGYLVAISATAAFFAKSISACPDTQAGILKPKKRKTKPMQPLKQAA